jgi:Cu+-exporting ATPase
VWLLENLFRLHPGIGHSQVNFPRREVAIRFATEKIALSELVTLLASIGYEPRLTLGELEKPRRDSACKRRWLQVGVAGFAFGNIMLFSLPAYLSMDSFSGPLFRVLFGYLSLALAVPVLFYSASDYWRSALLSLRQRVLTLDVPIALGLAALYAQSAFEIIARHGEGYLDSLAGLVFFLLCGRVFQQKTHDRMAFDRDYKCFFPLAVTRKTAAGEESAAISNLRVADRLLLRNGELIPADARLVHGPAFIDYSFVTGESEPISREPGDYLYAGGKQMGGIIEIETVKPVSQSYLTSLWNHETFQKERADNLNTLTNRYSRRFTRLVIGVAAGAALFWVLSGDAARGLKAFTSVLIVACPCALALAAPFTLGTAQRRLARIQVFLKNALVLERMAQVDTIVFDKTGTLTKCGVQSVECRMFDQSLLTSTATENGFGASEQSWLFSLVRHSTHPHSVRIGEWLAGRHAPGPVHSFRETPGSGIEGSVQGHELRLGSRAWLESCGVAVPALALPPGSVSYLAIDGAFRGAFELASALRPDTGQLLSQLGKHYEIALLSGDNEKERERFRSLFGSDARLQFNRSPLEKLGFIRQLQDSGKIVMMVGDGLNDAGALKQSDVGVAVVEKAGAFSPASDVILEAAQVPRLFKMLLLARSATRIVRISFAISALYNLVGISIAAAGILSPLICAILMPLSSISVVLFACGTTNWAARKAGLMK